MTRWDGVAAQRGPDEVIVEEPMAIQLDGVLVATTMRTPGHDYELAVGYCLTEGLLAGVPVESVRYCATGSASETDFNVVTVETGGRGRHPRHGSRATTSSCGICGSAELDELLERLEPLAASRTCSARVAGRPRRCRPRRPTAVRLDRRGPWCRRLRHGRHRPRGPGGRRPPQRGRQGDRAAAARRPPPRPRPGVGGDQSRQLRDRAEVVGGRLLRVVAVSAPTALAVTAARGRG